MQTQEEEFRLIYNQFLAWKASQKGQKDGYEYERSFVELCKSMNKELFSLATPVIDKLPKKKVITSFGKVQVNKSHCLSARAGKKGFQTSAYLQEVACFVAQSVPFDEGSAILAKIGHISLTDKQIERIGHHYGEMLETQIVEESAAKSPDASLHYAMMDGSMVFIKGKENGWKELKLGRVFSDASAYQEKKRGVIKESDYVAHLGNSEDFLNKFEHLISSKTNLVAISDGARWIWEYWDTFHPQATQILDFFHVMEKIGLWATLILKEEKERKSWMKCCEELLLNNEVGEIIVQIEAVVCVGDLLKKQKELLTYLLNNQRRMQYKTYKDKGLFIGSGAIEAAKECIVNKFLI